MVIDLDISHFSFLVTLVSLTFLVAINNLEISVYKKIAINSLMFCEGITLTFFFGKFPFVLSSFIVIFSLYFINVSKASDKKYSRQNFLLSFVGSGSKSKLFGTGIVLLVLIYELFADNEFSSSSLLFTVIGLIFLLYDFLPEKFSYEIDFSLLFFSLIALVFFVPNILYKLIFGYQGTANFIPHFFESDFFVYHALGLPLGNLLSLFGMNVIVNGDTIGFENLKSGLFTYVVIAKSCSGITSIQVFLSALISYLWIEKRLFKLDSIIIMALAVLVSYFANIIRMAVIVYIGHIYGIDSMKFAHEYLGWIFFSLIIFAFWSFLPQRLMTIHLGETQ